MMDGYSEKSHYDDEPADGNFVRAFDAFRRNTLPARSLPAVCPKPAS